MPNEIELHYGYQSTLSDTTFPGSGTWAVGDFVWNSAPVIGAPLGWVCTTAGTTGGTWTPVASLPQTTAVTANTVAANISATAGIVSITGSGGYNLTLTTATSAQPVLSVSFVNASSGTVTIVAGTGGAIVGVATIATNVSSQFRSVGTNWYHI